MSYKLSGVHLLFKLVAVASYPVCHSYMPYATELILLENILSIIMSLREKNKCLLLELWYNRAFNNAHFKAASLNRIWKLIIYLDVH